MRRRHTRWQLILTVTLLLIWLGGVVLTQPGVVFSAPSGQDKTINLNYGESYSDTLTAQDAADTFDDFIYQVNIPPGEQLSVAVGTDEQGNCYWSAIIYVNGEYIDAAYSGGEPNAWSEYAVATVPNGSAQVKVVADTTCIGVTYPVKVYVYFEVSGTPPPEYPTDTPIPYQPRDAEINFWADQEYIQRGQCTTLHWDVENVNAVYYQGQGVAGHDSRQECPQQTTTYELRVITDQGEVTRYVTVNVEQPPPTPRPTDTRLPPTAIPTQAPTSTSTDEACPDYYEKNDSPNSTFVLSTGTFQSYICEPRDVDYFFIPLSQHDRITVRLHSMPADYELEFYAPGGDERLGGSYNESTAQEEISYVAKKRGDYLIKVYSVGGFDDQNPYLLTIEVSKEPTATYRPTPTPMPTPSITPTSLPAALSVSGFDTERPWVLVVTDSDALNGQVNRTDAWTTIEGWLQDRYGRIDVLDLHAEGINNQNWQTIDREIETRVASYRQQPNYILIIGGPQVVAFSELPNPTSDGDTIFTDDVYADFNRDNLSLPDIPTARLPDGEDFELYNAQFSISSGRTFQKWGERFSTSAVGHLWRPYVHDIAALLGVQAQISPNMNSTNIQSLWNSYFILHGSDRDTSEWYGDGDPPGCCRSDDPLAFVADRAFGSLGTVVSGACYGAYINELGLQSGAPTGSFPTTQNSIALRFLRNATEAFIGSTTMGYSVKDVLHVEMESCLPLVGCWGKHTVVYDEDWHQSHAYFALQTWRRIVNGEHPMSAYYAAKYDLVSALGPPGIANQEEKALHSMVYYGLPPAP